MDRQQPLDLCRQLVDEIQFLIRFEQERCDTHKQRNAAMQLIRVATEKLQTNLLYVKAAPTNPALDEIPF